MDIRKQASRGEKMMEKKRLKKCMFTMLMTAMMVFLVTGSPKQAMAKGLVTTNNIKSDYTVTEIDEKTVAIAKYNGADKDVAVPSEIGGKKVVSISYLAFSYNSSIETITIPEGVEYIGVEAIFGCDALTTINLPKTCEIGGGAFVNECPKVAAINLPADHPSLKLVDGVLYTKDGKMIVRYPQGKPGKEYTILDGVTSIADDAFAHVVELEKVVMPDTVTYMGYWSFNCCRNLKEINISKKCEIIGQFALQNTKITSIYIPASVEWIMTYCFNGCKELKTITADPASKYYYTKDNVLYSKYGRLTWYSPLKEDKIFYVPEGIKTIEDEVFADAYNLEEVHIPESVTLIERGVFWDCYNLKKIYMPYSIKQIGEYCLANVWGVTVYGYENTPVQTFCETGTDGSVGCTFQSMGRYEEVTIKKNETQSLVAKKDGAVIANADIIWSSDDIKIATINNGVVTAVASGTTIIRGKYQDDYTFIYQVTVPEEPKPEKEKVIPVKKLSLNKKTLTLTKGKSAKLKLTVIPANTTNTWKWTSNNPKIATVSKTGKVVAKKAGSTAITVKASNGKKVTCKIIVKEKNVKKLTLNKKTLTLKKGKSGKLKLTLTPADATNNLKWTSSNKKVATVDANGKVVAKRAGTATITVKASNGKKVTCKVRVR